MGVKRVRKRSSKGESSNPTSVKRENFHHPSPIKSYIMAGLLVLVIALLAIISVAYFTNKKGMKNAEAYFILNQALTNPTENPENKEDEEKLIEVKKGKLEEVINNYPTSPAAQDAKFYLAKILFDQEKFDEAAHQFSEFYKQYPSYDPFSMSAQIAEANCLMATNDFKNAKIKFQDIIAKAQAAPEKEGVLASATYKVAVCDFLLGQYEEAKSKLNSLLASPVDEFSKEKAQSFLAKLDIIPLEKMREAILPSQASSSSPSAVDSAENNNEEGSSSQSVSQDTDADEVIKNAEDASEEGKDNQDIVRDADTKAVSKITENVSQESSNQGDDQATNIKEASNVIEEDTNEEGSNSQGVSQDTGTNEVSEPKEKGE